MCFEIYFTCTEGIGIPSGNEGVELKLDGNDILSNGFPDLRGVSPGKTLTLTYPFGELAGVIRGKRGVEWTFTAHGWRKISRIFGCSKKGDSFVVLLDGCWKGSKKGLSRGNAYAFPSFIFHPLGIEYKPEKKPAKDKLRKS